MSKKRVLETKIDTPNTLSNTIKTDIRVNKNKEKVLTKEEKSKKKIMDSMTPSKHNKTINFFLKKENNTKKKKRKVIKEKNIIFFNNL